MTHLQQTYVLEGDALIQLCFLICEAACLSSWARPVRPRRFQVHNISDTVASVSNIRFFDEDLDKFELTGVGLFALLS